MRHDTSSCRRLKPSCAAPRLGVEATLTDIRPEVPLCNALVVMLWSVCSKLLLVQRFEWPLAVVKVRTKGRPDSVAKSLTEAIFVVFFPFSAATLQLYEGQWDDSRGH